MNHLAKTIKIFNEASKPAADFALPVHHNLAWLVSIEGTGFPSGTISVVREVTIIGSAEGCDLRILNDSTVSRQHVTIIRLQDNLYYVKDLGATNPVRLNSRALEPRERCRLVDGDELKIGCSIICFKDLV